MSRNTPPASSHKPPRGALGGRLTRLALAAAALALLVSGGVLNLAVYAQARDGLVDEITTQARVIAANLEAAVMFGDGRAAGEMLSSLERSPGVQRVTVFDARGAVFADYRRADLPSGALTLLAAAGPPGHVLTGGLLVVTERIEHRGQTLGRLRFEVPLAPLHRRAWLFAAVTVGTAIGAMLLAWLLAVGVRRDVDGIERRLDQLAHRDPVTGLFNRHAAHEHLPGYLVQAQRAGSGFAVVTLDLDDFKTVNDTLGHHIGDQMLKLVAERLGQVLPPDARAYRFGGDEFVVIVPGVGDAAEADRAGQLVRQALGNTVLVDGIEMQLGGSVGIARYPADGLLAEEVLLASDMAMYQAKAGGKNQVVTFHAALREGNEQQLRTVSELRTGLRQGQLLLHFQPIVELATGRLVGAEALLRWCHPERGLVPPAQFVGVAERSGLIAELGGWVLHEAARQQMRWRAAGLPVCPVAVNVSARQLRGGLLLQQVEQALAATGCEPGWLEIELTEHTLVEDVEDNLQLLESLRKRGLRIGIDDFGTGLSSLAYLKRLPASKLKIDRSFVRDLPLDRGDAAIVEAAVSMAHALGLQVVAEGVETEDQHRLLSRLGCGFGQGYLYSPALDAEAFAEWALGRLASADALERSFGRVG